MNLWILLANSVTGYADVTASLVPPTINNIFTWEKEISKDPGKPVTVVGEPKKEPTWKGKKGRKQSGKGKG